MNLLEFQKTFPGEAACLAHLEERRWGKDGVNRFCPHCGSVKTYKFKSGKLFKCGDCRKQFTAKIGTIFSDSKIPLQKWYLAIFLAGSLKKGISSTRLAEYISVTQKTAWFMLHRIRAAFENGNHNETLGDGGDKPIEVDETYYGKHRDKYDAQNKATVFGMLERGGSVRTAVTKRSTAKILLPILTNTIAPGSTVHTDQAGLYKSLVSRGYRHEKVNHGIGEYVRGDVTTNSLEGFWSHFKRTVIGTYHYVSFKHLERYVNESAYRYNTRQLNDGERFEAWFAQMNCRIKYKELVNVAN